MNSKKIKAILFFLICGQVYSASYKDMFDIVHRNELYYSSYLFMKKSILSNEKIDQAKVNTVLDLIHPSVFIHDHDLDRFMHKSTQLNYPVAVRRFFFNDFNTAKKLLTRVPASNSMYIESNYLLGLIYLTENKPSLSSRYFKRCVRYSANKKRTRFKSEQYIRTFKNRCIQQVARLNFSNKNFKATLRVLDYVKKTDYIWPRFLLDRAWAHYWLGELPRSLGSVMTFKAPLLRRFMVPEANYLRALIYFDMCYFEKTEKIYNDFTKNTWKYRNTAKTVSKNRLLKLISESKEPAREEDRFLYYYLKGYKKDIRYFSYLEASEQLDREIASLSRIRGLNQAKIFLNSLYYYKRAIKEDFKGFLKNLSDDYYVQIKQTRNAFVKLNLMVSLKKRKNISKNQSTNFKDDFKSVDLDSISRTKDKFVWDFQGGFWADELGDYAIALDNRCDK